MEVPGHEHEPAARRYRADPAGRLQPGHQRSTRAGPRKCGRPVPRREGRHNQRLRERDGPPGVRLRGPLRSGRHDVTTFTAKLLGRLHPQHSRLLTARFDDALAGWVVLNRDACRLVGHWGTVHHLQTHPEFRGRGVGSALMRELRRITRDDLGLERLHLAARGGEGLEDFFSRLGGREVGRWPGALRLAPDDPRDEVVMLLDPL
ncbi:GNAT family N-acetyltransferase [Streptomyces sp. NPDC056568]|uniref:GNAT family N-acetyltransferase n=1 Tax=Streptomyces sp. NPDC056568 TaxID=3345866 RepID=UPI0036B547B1